MTKNDFPADQTFQRFHDLDSGLDLHIIMSGFHGAFTMGVASQQGTLTLPDIWFRPPFGTCLCSNCPDQITRTCHSLLDFSLWIPLGVSWPKDLLIDDCLIHVREDTYITLKLCIGFDFFFFSKEIKSFIQIFL